MWVAGIILDVGRLLHEPALVVDADGSAADALDGPGRRERPRQAEPPPAEEQRFLRRHLLVEHQPAPGPADRGHDDGHRPHRFSGRRPPEDVVDLDTCQCGEQRQERRQVPALVKPAAFQPLPQQPPHAGPEQQRPERDPGQDRPAVQAGEVHADQGQEDHREYDQRQQRDDHPAHAHAVPEQGADAERQDERRRPAEPRPSDRERVQQHRRPHAVSSPGIQYRQRTSGAWSCRCRGRRD